eukprot:3972530-Prymnesium_polylepis.1
MKGGGEVQAGPSGTATPARGARGGRPLFAPFARLCAPHRMRKKLQPFAWRHVAKVSANMGPGIVHATLLVSCA